MTLNDDNLTRVAKHLDGQHATLSTAEEALAAEIRRDEQAVAPMLDVHGANMARALAKAQRQVSAEFAGKRHGLRIVLWGGAVAAAAVLLLVVVLQMRLGDTSSNQLASPKAPAKVVPNSVPEGFPDFSAVEASDADADLELLTDLGSENELGESLDAQVIDSVLLEEAT